MKLLPVLLLACVLSLGVACASEASEPPPDVPTFAEGEAIGLVQGMFRAASIATSLKYGRYDHCYQLGKNGDYSAWYMGEGVWEVKASAEVWKGSNYARPEGLLTNKWRVHEGSNAVERGEGKLVAPSGHESTVNCPYSR
jgi:hypothetical protein